ncbi:hypothetical protein QTP88_003035 [Uroleucon formosanum]
MGTLDLHQFFFTQLYVVRVQKDSVFITAIYCILERKTQSTYEHIFRVIMEECKKRDLYPDPLNFNLDFELAVINAAKLIFGNDINIRGCFYHLCQSTYRKVQELGLSNRYQNKSIRFRLFCTMIDSLDFLPLNKVKEGMEYLKQNISNEADDLLIYFEAYYVNGSYRRIGNTTGINVNVRLRRVQPMFPPNTWNVHDTTLHVSQKHPTIWKLIRKIKNEVVADLEKLALNDVGEPFNKRKKLELTQTTEKRLKELCTQIQNDEIIVEDFLKAIAHNIRKRCGIWIVTNMLACDEEEFSEDGDQSTFNDEFRRPEKICTIKPPLKTKQRGVQLDDVNRAALDFFNSKKKKIVPEEEDPDLCFLKSLLPDIYLFIYLFTKYTGFPYKH